MATKHFRLSPGESLIIGRQYRVTAVKKGRDTELVIETVELVEGEPVYTRTGKSLDILIDGRQRRQLE